MLKTVPMIGLHAEELPWIRMLTALLRHADPMVAELTRQALLYLSQHAGTEPDTPALSQPAR